MGKISVKRIYDKQAPTDGLRILVDRLWPRGMTKGAAHLDEWMKEAAPSRALRQWFAHNPDRFESFKEQYMQELDQADGEAGRTLHKLRQMVRGKEPVTLLYAAKDERYNQAVVLKEWLEEKEGMNKQS